MDEIRGLAILLVVLYHFLFDLQNLYGYQVPWLFTPAGDVFRDGIAFSLIFISGVSCQYSRSNLRRGVKTLIIALLITLLTWLLMPEERILFGILHFLGTAMILYHVFSGVLKNLRPGYGMTLCLLMFVITRRIEWGYIGFAPWLTLKLPAVFYQNWLFPLGFYGAGFFSADYYPIIPWIFAFFSGVYFGMFVSRGQLPDGFYRTHFRGLAKIGRHTLPIYLIHQPVILLILYILLVMLPAMH